MRERKRSQVLAVSVWECVAVMVLSLESSFSFSGKSCEAPSLLHKVQSRKSKTPRRQTDRKGCLLPPASRRQPSAPSLSCLLDVTTAELLVSTTARQRTTEGEKRNRKVEREEDRCVDCCLVSCFF